MDSTSRSGRSWRNCAARRSELVPTLAPRRQIGERAADHGVARIFALGNGGQHEAFGQFGRQILQAVHREIGAPVEQRFFDLLGEEALGADLGQRHVGDLVAGGLDDFDAALVAGGGELRGDPAGLPQCELRTARCDDEHESVLEVERLSDGGDDVRAFGLAGVRCAAPRWGRARSC